MSDTGKGEYPDPFEKAFQQLYPILVLFAVRIIRDEDLANIIVVDGFLELLNDGADFSDIVEIRKRLYVIIRHDCIDYWRKHHSNDGRFREWVAWLLQEMSTEIESQARGLEADEDLAQLLKMVMEEMKKLPPTGRQTLEDMFIHGKSAEEIARERNINTSSVYDTRKNALIRLRKALIGALRQFWLLIIVLLRHCGGK